MMIQTPPFFTDLCCFTSALVYSLAISMRFVRLQQQLYIKWKGFYIIVVINRQVIGVNGGPVLVCGILNVIVMCELIYCCTLIDPVTNDNDSLLMYH